MHVAIVGNGITGITAAMTLRRLQPTWRISVISGESTFHYSRPALMYVFMGHMRYADTKPYEDDVWERQRIDLVRAWVARVDPLAKRLELEGGGALDYDKLLLATGSVSNRFGWPGQDLPGVQGLYGLQDLKQLHDAVSAGVRRAVVVGGGLIGIELAEMLHSRRVEVTLLVRERSYWDNVLPAEESAMVTRLIREARLDLRLEAELKEILPGPDGRAAAVVTGAGERLECQLVGLTAGVKPNVELARRSGIGVGRGVLVDAWLRTPTADVFAAGDCAELVAEGGGRNLVQQVWYTGRLQGDCVAHTIAGEARRYDPGIWFNSAKFLGLEYQTYGAVAPLPQPGETRLWWERHDGRQGLRLVGRDGAVTGFNAMGLRLRHEVCERWLRERRPLRQVVAHLVEAVFEPELFWRPERSIARALSDQLAAVPA